MRRVKRLMFQTWTFQNTDSLEMIGCRSCFGKSEKDLYPTMNECKMCLTKNDYFNCGKLNLSKYILCKTITFN